MVIGRILMASLAAALAGGEAFAQTGPRAITLEEAVEMARRNAPAIVQAHGQTRTTASAVRASYASFIPAVSVSAGATRQLPTGARTRIENGQVIVLPAEPWSSSIGFSANVLLFEGGQRFFDLRQARARATAARVNEQAEHFSTTLDAKIRFFDVLAAREAQLAATALLGQAQQQRVTAIARSRARAATRSDSLRAEIQVRNAALAVLESRNALEAANASLTRVVGSTEPITAAVTDSLESPELTVDDVQLRALAESGPEVQQAQAARDAAHAAAKSSWTDFLPSLSASYSRSGNNTAATPVYDPDSFDYAGSVRFSASLPIFDQMRREQRVVEGRVAEDNAEAALRDTRLAAVEALTQALGTFRSAAERVDSETATVEAAREDLRVQQQRYSVGGSTLLDVLASQTQLDQALRDLIRGRYDQRIAKAQIEALVGRDL